MSNVAIFLLWLVLGTVLEQEQVPQVARPLSAWRVGLAWGPGAPGVPVGAQPPQVWGWVLALIRADGDEPEEMGCFALLVPRSSGGAARGVQPW